MRTVTIIVRDSDGKTITSSDRTIEMELLLSYEDKKSALWDVVRYLNKNVDDRISANVRNEARSKTKEMSEQPRSLDGLVLFQHAGHRHDGKKGTIIEGDPSCCIVEFEDGTCFGPCGPNSGDNIVVLEENVTGEPEGATK